MTDKVTRPNDSRTLEVSDQYCDFWVSSWEALQLAQREIRGIGYAVLLNRWVGMMFIEPRIWSWPPLSQIEFISIFWLIKLDPIDF